MRGIDDLDVAGQTVLLRVDLNVPLRRRPDHRRRPDPGQPADHQQADQPRRAGAGLRAPGPAQGRQLRRARGGRPVAGGRWPRGWASCSARRSRWPPTWPGPARRRSPRAWATAQVALLENVRFSPAETSKDDAERGELARNLAALAQLYVGDGFGALHRKHASVYDVALLLPHAAGDLVLAEVEVLHRLTTDPARPYVVVLGGAKPSDKLAVISNLLDSADRLLIGGGMSYTFLAAQRLRGRSLAAGG